MLLLLLRDSALQSELVSYQRGGKKKEKDAGGTDSPKHGCPVHGSHPQGLYPHQIHGTLKHRLKPKPRAILIHIVLPYYHNLGLKNVFSCSMLKSKEDNTQPASFDKGAIFSFVQMKQV